MKIEPGAYIKLTYVDAEGVTWWHYGILKHTPQGPGDLFCYEVPDGTLVEFNPYHRDFACMEQVSEEGRSLSLTAAS